jgi:hypothetical protein
MGAIVLNGIERTKPPAERVPLDQPFGHAELRFADCGHQELLRHDVLLELARQQAGVLPADKLRMDFDREDRREFHDSQPGNPDLDAGRLDNLVNLGCSEFRV